MASYEPKQWKCGDTITADDLNHMEEGIKGNESKLIPTVDKTIIVDGVERKVIGFIDANGNQLEKPLFVNESLDSISSTDVFAISYRGMTVEVQPLMMSGKDTLRGVGSDYEPSESGAYLIEDTDVKYVAYYSIDGEIIDSVVMPSTANIQYIATK